MTSGVRLAAALAVLVVGLALAIGGTAAGSGKAKIDALVLRDTAGGKKASFLIHLRDQADLRAAYRIRDQDARGWFVYRALRRHASRSQAPIRALLEARNASYTPYWVANVIVARGDRQLVQELARRRDVSAIESNARSNWLEGEEASGTSPATVEPGVVQVHAPEVWALGHTGQGIVIANQDTGMRWTHNAL
jgi:serine protease AprX